MEQEKLKIFIDSVIDYFDKMTGTKLETGVPYLKGDDSNVLMNYTGVIGISGKMIGAIYFTAQEDFLFELLKKIMPSAEKSEKKLASMAGELANTIAGNAQKTLGSDFYISIPMILTNDSDVNSSSLELKAPTFVIPLKWLNHEAYLVIGLQK